MEFKHHENCSEPGNSSATRTRWERAGASTLQFNPYTTTETEIESRFDQLRLNIMRKRAEWQSQTPENPVAVLLGREEIAVCLAFRRTCRFMDMTRLDPLMPRGSYSNRAQEIMGLRVVEGQELSTIRIV